MAVESWRYGDPAKVLERQGEGCDNCRNLEQWAVADKAVTVCAKKRKVGKRCEHWQHKGENKQ